MSIIVEKKNNLVLDGQHRLEAAKMLGLIRLPALFVDYNDVEVWTLRPEIKITRLSVVKNARSGKIYPYKTVKHKFNFDVPDSLNIDLDELMEIQK